MWQRAITIDGEWIAGCAICEELPGRAFFVAYASEDLVSFFQIRPMLEEFKIACRLGPWKELRAWVLTGSEREERFAARFGFKFDCGPATGISPTGLDMGLWKWTRESDV